MSTTITTTSVPYSTEIEQLLEIAKTNTESFRAAAMDALKVFSPPDRDVATRVATDRITLQEVLDAWEKSILPVRAQLESKTTINDLKAYLVKQLGFEETQSQARARALIEEREEQVVCDCIDHLYPKPANGKKDAFAEQRHCAKELFAQKDEEIKSFKQRYENLVQHVQVAQKQQVTVCDVHSSWIERRKCARQIQKERQRSWEQEEKRLHDIEHQLELLAGSHDGLLGKITDNGWDYAVIMDLRHQYEKKLGELPEKDRTSAKHLQIYKKVTRAFRERETEKLTILI
jgi:hypothetical protein